MHFLNSVQVLHPSHVSVLTMLMDGCGVYSTGFASNDTDASAKALNGGLDVYGGWGDHLWEQGYLHQAIKSGETTEAALNLAMFRTTVQKMKVGAFDPLAAQSEWTSLGVKDLNTTAHQQVAYDAALQSIVLLKNGGGDDASKEDGAKAPDVAASLPLPLKRGIKLAVVGPLAFETTGLVSDYAAWHMNPEKGRQTQNPPSLAEALARANTGGSTVAEIGVQVASSDTTGVAAALAAVSTADAVVIILGMTKKEEHEGMDRSGTKLPGVQEQFALQVNAAAAAAKIPVVLVLCNGGILSIDTLIAGSSAIVEAFNPVDHGTKAVAESLFGGANKWGRFCFKHGRALGGVAASNPIWPQISKNTLNQPSINLLAYFWAFSFPSSRGLFPRRQENSPSRSTMQSTRHSWMLLVRVLPTTLLPRGQSDNFVAPIPPRICSRTLVCCFVPQETSKGTAQSISDLSVQLACCLLFSADVRSSDDVITF